MKKELKEFIRILAQEEGSIKKDCKRRVKRVLKELLEEVALVKREAHCQSNEEVGNGFYSRDLEGLIGKLEGLKISRTRKVKFRPFFIEPYRRVSYQLEELVIAMYQGGCSTRDISKTIGALLDRRYSTSWVSRITHVVQEKVESFRNRRLKNTIP